MPRRRAGDPPTYRRQRRPGGRDVAFVEVQGRRLYLGPYDDAASRERYHRICAEIAATGGLAIEAGDLTIRRLIVHYYAHVLNVYCDDDGRPTSHQHQIRRALQTLEEIYGSELAEEFGPRALKTLRAQWVREGLSRKTANEYTHRVRAMFRWAVAEEMIPAQVCDALTKLPDLRRGSGAAEPEPVTPVDDAVVEATIAHPKCPPTLRDMIRVQRLTGMRSGELVRLRPSQIDQSQAVWVYRPAQHKTTHLGHVRIVTIGPKAQQILTPRLGDPDSYVFSPRTAIRERKSAAKVRRRPDQPEYRITNRKVRDHYTPGSYRRAIARLCDLVFPPPAGLKADKVLEWRKQHRWHPHQLRHTFLTEVRRRYGLEAAQVVAGHRHADVTEIYAEANAGRASEVAAELG